MSEGKHTPGPWTVGNCNPLLFGRPQGNGTELIGFVYGPSFPELSDVGLRAMADARLIAAAPDLLAALLAFQAAQAMSNYGDASDFVWPKLTMRKPGEHAWGYICEKHGLGYQSGCICCAGDLKRHGERKDAEARRARDDALHNADRAARAAIAAATQGGQA